MGYTLQKYQLTKYRSDPRINALTTCCELATARDWARRAFRVVSMANDCRLGKDAGSCRANRARSRELDATYNAPERPVAVLLCAEGTATP